MESLLWSPKQCRSIYDRDTFVSYEPKQQQTIFEHQVNTIELGEYSGMFSTNAIKIYFLCQKFLRTKYEAIQPQHEDRTRKLSTVIDHSYLEPSGTLLVKGCFLFFLE